MVPELGESVVVSSGHPLVDDRSLRRRRYVKLCLVALPVLAVLVLCPVALKSDYFSLGAAETQAVSPSMTPTANTNGLAKRSQMPRAPVLAIMADYDNCWDIMSPTNPKNRPGKVTRGKARAGNRLVRAVSNVAAERERIILFVGSARQSQGIDRYLARTNGNGVALGRDEAYEQWVEKNKHRGWELNRALLADGDEPFSAWDNSSKTYHWEAGEEMKLKLVENNLRQLQGLDSVDVYLFDDVKAYLEYVRLHVVTPPNVNLYTVHYDAKLYSEALVFRHIAATDGNGRKWNLV